MLDCKSTKISFDSYTPFKSVPEEAAVGDVFGTFAVLVAETLT